jgi:hypothetical protein
MSAPVKGQGVGKNPDGIFASALQLATIWECLQFEVLTSGRIMHP